MYRRRNSADTRLSRRGRFVFLGVGGAARVVVGHLG